MSSRRIQMLLLCTVACFLINNVHSLRPRILGGRDPTPNEVKYLVAIQSVTSLCGGGIIDDKFIVTAAHCVRVDQKTGTLAKPTKIYAILNNTRIITAETININVVRAFLPKGTKLPYGDIAVLELEKSLDLKNNDKLQKLELPRSHAEFSGARTDSYPSYDDLIVKFAGFGRSRIEKKDANGKVIKVTTGSGPLQVAKAKIVDIKTCRSKYYGTFVQDSQVCVRIIEDENLVRHQGVCTGDSGSPIVFSNKIIVGVASFVTDNLCNTNRRPAVFTRISSYIEFIKNVVKGDTANTIIIKN